MSHICAALQTYTERMTNAHVAKTWSNALVEPDSDGKTPLLCVSESGQSLQLTFVLSVLIVSRVKVTPKTAQLEQSIEKWFNMINGDSNKKLKRHFELCMMAAAGNEQTRNVFTKETQSIDGMLKLLSDVGGKARIFPTHIKVRIALVRRELIHAKSAGKKKRRKGSKKKSTLVNNKHDEYTYLDTYVDTYYVDDDEVEEEHEEHDCFANIITYVDDDEVEEEHEEHDCFANAVASRIIDDTHDIAEDDYIACEVQATIEQVREPFFELEKQCRMQEDASACIKIIDLQLDVQYLKEFSEWDSQRLHECDWPSDSDDSESWYEVSDVQSVHSFTSSIPFSYKDAILMKSDYPEQKFGNCPNILQPARFVEPTVKVLELSASFYDEEQDAMQCNSMIYEERDGYKGGRGKGNNRRSFERRG